MIERELAKTGELVGAVGLGCMGMSWGYQESQRDDAVSIGVIRTAVDAGVTVIDTADIYGDGHNEELVGKALQGIRDDVLLATKGGLVVDGLQSRAMHRNASPAYMRGAVDASLNRLGVDHIDLYYLHRVDDHVPLEETWAALAELVQQGKIRYLGLSEVSVTQATLAQSIHPVTAIQSEMSLWTRDALTAAPGSGQDLLRWTSNNGTAFVPFAPLGRGYLTGDIDSNTSFESSDFRSFNPRFSDDARKANESILDVVRAVATRREVTPAQVSIAWALAQAENVIPIPGTKSVTHLNDNINATSLNLSASDLHELDSIPQASGTRY